MKLSELDSRKAGSRTRYHSIVADELGNKHFEVECSGPKALVERVMADADIGIRIRPRATQHDLQKELQESWPGAHQDLAPLAFDPFAKKPKRLRTTTPTAANSVVLRLSRTEGTGTVYAITLPSLVLPAGFNFFLAMPPACNIFATVAPLAGDADLFLTLNSPFPPTVAASVKGGTLVDSISFGSVFCFPPFVPFVRVNGFTTTVFNLTCFAFSLP